MGSYISITNDTKYIATGLKLANIAGDWQKGLSCDTLKP